MKSRILAAKISLAITLALAAPSANAQISVIDVANVRQTTVSALQNVATVAKQIQQYQTQLQQYQNMIQNTVGAPVQLWQQATQTIDSLQGQVNQISSFARQAGDVNTYMNQFKNPSYYQTNACTSGNCTAAQRDGGSVRYARARTTSQMAANADAMNGINSAMTTLASDGQRLDQLQANATGASGQMQALSYANQFAAQQASELQKIRGVLLAQSAALTAQSQYQLDRDAAAMETGIGRKCGKPSRPRSEPTRIKEQAHVSNSASTYRRVLLRRCADRRRGLRQVRRPNRKRCSITLNT
jgi:P-type conjugative transfer protein TrbJ